MLDREQIRKLRSEGKTYQQIANIFGVSRQRIEQVMNNRKCLKSGLREHILTVRHHKCIRCDKNYDDSELEIHHLDFNTSNNNITNLYVICRSCHKNYHRLQKNNLCSLCGDNTYKLVGSKKYGKLCEKCYQEKVVEAKLKRKELLKSKFKECVRCGNINVYNFTHGLCKKCNTSKIYEDNKESHKKAVINWRLKNTEKVKRINRECAKRYWEKNKDELNRKARESYYENHEKNKERNRYYYHKYKNMAKIRDK